MSPDAAAAVVVLAEKLVAADEARAGLARRLEAALKAREESGRQGAALGEMRRRVELRRARAEELLLAKRDALRGVQRRKEQLQARIDRVVHLSGAVAAADRRVQEAKEVLSGEKVRLGDLQRLLRMRQQSMIAQVAALYPVKVFHDLPHHGQNLDAGTNGAHGALSEENGTLPEENGTHILNIIKIPQVHALTFLGWQIGKHRRKQKDVSEKDLQRSAAVLGYAAHAVLLIASYLHVPLRYPLHFGGSRSYDTEQLLNYIGVESSGTGRRVFGNLQQLLRIIQSDEYICVGKGQAMGVETDHDTPCIKTILRCSIRMSYRYASENWVLLFPILLLYLLFRCLPGFFAFLLSHSPVIICATLILGVLISHGNTNCSNIDEDQKVLADSSAAQFADFSRDIHFDANKRFSVPSFKENTVSLKDGEINDASFSRVLGTKHCEMDDDSVPLLKGIVQENEKSDAFDRLEGTLTSIHPMEANQKRESKDPIFSDDKATMCANMFEVIHQSRADENQATRGLYSSRENVMEDDEMIAKTNHDRGSTDTQSDEVSVVSEDKPAGTKCKWGRAFSVRRRKKLSDIKVEAIDAAVDNQLDSSSGSPISRVRSHDGSSGFDLDQAENTTPVTPTTHIVSVLDEIDPYLSSDFSHPDQIQNDYSDNHSGMPPQDCRIDNDSNDETDKSKPKVNDEKNESVDPAFPGTGDDEKNVMDLGYSEMERNRRIEILMAKRRSRKNIIFDLDNNLIDVDKNQVFKRNPSNLLSCSDETELPGSAPSILHPGRNPFDHPFGQSDESDLHEHENLGPQKYMAVPHRDMFFTRHESFNVVNQGRRPSRFKPSFILDSMDTEEPSSSDFQRQIKSVSTLSAVTESDAISSVADQEDISANIKDDSIREYEAPNLPTMGSDIICVGGKCSDGIKFLNNDTLNAITNGAST
uniref:Uncharacterized protein n=1 Tax=Leersia perrieri TaxID=77586 RepID=A0A0D9WI02_9ORYZ